MHMRYGILDVSAGRESLTTFFSDIAGAAPEPRDPLTEAQQRWIRETPHAAQRAAMLLLYGALDVLYAAKAALEAPCGKLLTFICLPFLFPVVHIVYGTGTLCGLLTGKAESHA